MAKFYPLQTQLEASIAKGLRKAGRKMLKRMRELSPSDSGATDKTGFAAVDDLTLQVGFTSHVAAVQNENLDYRHENGQAKFAETTVDEINIGPILAEQHQQDKLRG
ncbi:hypothetical protein [Microbacterium testaceum]|uniref:Uncharacterized protein n=1 Tax=Microbacterium testaceum TaxID=2033 RepID=A0A147F587_MICTE|nr:hypothetical protein [Microbacterium testaceum]KTS09040.1 hypothetical protein RSA3_14150 [Microbacterium testaceum]